MASEGLIAALAANWDGGDNSGALHTGPVTLANLTAALKLWMEGKPTPNLGSRIEQMRERVLEVARSTEQDLQGKLAPDLRGPLQASLDAYEGLDPVLEALAEAHAGGNRAVKNLVAFLEKTRTQLLECDQAMHAWLRAPVLRCPRCGLTRDSGGARCPDCNVDLLYPDPESALSDAQTSAHLGPEYIEVFQALSLVVEGEAPLSRLLGALDRLETMLRNWAMLAEAEETSNAQLTYALDTVADAARRSLEGAAQMRSVTQTRQTRDLNEGWRILFECAQDIRTSIPLIAKATGAAQRGDHFSTQERFQDSIVLDGDD